MTREDLKRDFEFIQLELLNTFEIDKETKPLDLEDGSIIYKLKTKDRSD